MYLRRQIALASFCLLSLATSNARAETAAERRQKSLERYNAGRQIYLQQQSGKRKTSNYQPGHRQNPGYPQNRQPSSYYGSPTDRSSNQAADARFNLGMSYLGRGQIGYAIRRFIEVLRYRPNDQGACFQLGVCYEIEGDLSAAAKFYSLVNSSHPRYQEAQSKLATLAPGAARSIPPAAAPPYATMPGASATRMPGGTMPGATFPSATMPAASVLAAAMPPAPVTAPSTPVYVPTQIPAQSVPISPSALSAAQTSVTELGKPVNRPIKDKWALIVGISNFVDPSINLKYAAKDALDFKDFLIQNANFAPDHVRTLIDKEATRERILDEFGDSWLPRVAGPDDLVVVYVSTHGTPAEVDVGQVNYILAHDTDKNKLFSKGIPMQELCRLIKSRVSCDRVLIVLDTCFSGNTAPTGKSLNRTGNMSATEVALGTGQLVICSSSTNQRSWESMQYQNGIFTRKLIESLQTNGPKTTLGQAFAALKDKVEDEARRQYGTQQTPCMNGKWSGNELILAVPPATPKPGL
jgi:hypothetical protein